MRGEASSVRAVIMELKRTPFVGPHKEISPSRDVIEVVAKLKTTLKPFWGEL